MGKRNALSPEALALLKKIHERGLQVLWSFQSPRARWGRDYDSGENVSWHDWYVMSQNLWRSWVEEGRILVWHNTKMERAYKREGMIKTVQVDIILENEKSREKPRTVTYESGPFLTSKISVMYEQSVQLEAEQGWGDWEFWGERVLDTECEWMPTQERKWESDYIEVQHVEMDDFFEEHMGLMNRYSLTDLGRRLVGEFNEGDETSPPAPLHAGEGSQERG